MNQTPIAAQSAPASSPEGLLALAIEHQHGTDITIHRTREGALAKVDQFVADWWDTEMGEDDPMPEDAAEARQSYFEKVDESYIITDTAIFD